MQNTLDPKRFQSARPVSRLNVATTVALIGLHQLPYRHTFYMNITPRVCKGSEAIWAYIACALLALAACLINTWSLPFQDSGNLK